MNRIIIFLIFLTNHVFSQDTLFLSNGKIIIGKVIEIGPKFVLYNSKIKIDKRDYKIDKNILNKICYKDGAVEFFTHQETFYALSNIEFTDTFFVKHNKIYYGNAPFPELKLSQVIQNSNLPRVIEIRKEFHYMRKYRVNQIIFTVLGGALTVLPTAFGFSIWNTGESGNDFLYFSLSVSAVNGTAGFLTAGLCKKKRLKKQRLIVQMLNNS